MYLAGIFGDTLIFQASNRTDTLTTPNPLGGYLCKFSANLEFRWSGSFRPSPGGLCEVMAIAEDDSGKIYAAGQYYGTTDFDPGTATVALTPKGGQDLFIVKMDSGGNYIWVNSIGGGSYDVLSAIAIDKATGIYATGMIMGYVDFDNGPAVAGVTPVREYDAYFLKLRKPVPFVSTSVDQVDGDEKLMLYPNPATGNVTLAGKRAFSNAQVSLVSSDGRLLKYWVGVSGHTFSSDLSWLPAGIYLLTLTDDMGDRGSINFIRK